MSILTDYTGIVRERFVETGTQNGNTLWHAKDHFQQCVSIELDVRLYMKVEERFLHVPNVNLYHGHSPKMLREILDHRFSTTFWLDAHWDGTPLPLIEDEDDITECPLLEELYEIERINWRTPPIILIDDMRLFNGEEFAKQPNRWKVEEWPTMEQIDAALPGYHRTIVGTDVDPIIRYDHD